MDSGIDRQEKNELIITADRVQSTDERFTNKRNFLIGRSMCTACTGRRTGTSF